MKNKMGLTDRARQIVVALCCILLFVTIIGIPVALLLMQMERLIQLESDE